MSSYAGVCGWCGKDVMHKTLFGTLHLCLTQEEKLQIMMARQRQSPNKRWAEFVKQHPQLKQSAHTNQNTIKQKIGGEDE